MEPHGVENLTVKLPRVLLSEVIVKVADPLALIVRDDGVTLKLLGTDDGETVPLPPAVSVIVTVPCPRLEPTKNAFTLMRLPLTHGKQDVGPVKPGSLPEAVTAKFSPAKL